MTEDMTQENALDGPASFTSTLERCTGSPRSFCGRILRIDEACRVRVESAGSALRGGAWSGHRLPGVRGNGGYDPLPDKVKAAKKRACSQMAGPAEIHKKLDQRLAELSKFTRKFVDARLPVAVALPVQKARAALRQREKDCLECSGETPGFLLGI